MAEFNQFQVLDVVSLTSTGSVSTARLDSRPGVLFALKQLQVAAADPDEPQWEAQHFLDRARVQKGVVAAGGEYWLPVIGMGTNADGAWIATDYYPLSVQKLIDARTRLSASELGHIIDGIVCGLVELQQTRARAHGNLKSSNVIISPGDLSKSRVFLTDPLASATRDEAEDVLAVGQMIFQLVEQGPIESSSAPPVAESSAWERLGAQKTQWRELCSSLLAPTPAMRPSLPELSFAVRELSGRKRRKSSSSTQKRQLRSGPGRPRWLGRSIAVVCGIAAVVLVGLVTLNLISRSRLATARHRWADAFSNSLDDQVRRQRYLADPDLGHVVEHLELAGFPAGNRGVLSLLSIRNWADTRRGLDELNLAEQGLSDINWHGLAKLEDLRTQYESRGWKQPAAFLASVINPARTLDSNLAASVDHVLDLEPTIRKSADDVEACWSKIETAMRNLERPGDRTLTAFSRSLRERAGKSLTISDAGISGVEDLKVEAALATRLDRAIALDWPGNVDAPRLALDLGLSSNTVKPTRADMERWLANLPQYALCSTDTSIATGALMAHLKDIDALIVKSPPAPEDKKPFDQARQQVKSRIDVFSKTPFLEKELADGTLGNRRDAIDADITSLRRFARAETVAELARGFPPIATRSRAVNDYWNNWKQQTFADSANVRGGSLIRLKNRAAEMQSILIDIDQEMPMPPDDLTGGFHSAAGHHREADIAKLLSQIDARNVKLDPLQIANAASNLVDWNRQLKQLSQDFPIRKQILGPSDRLDEKWKSEGFLTDPEIHDLVSTDLARMAAIRRLATASRAQLIDTAQNGEPVEVALEGYRMLGGANLDPPWPSGATELSTDHEMRDRIEKMVAAVTNADERTGPEQMLQEQAPDRWKRVVEHARETQTLAAAWTLRQQFAIDDGQLDTLSPATRFNLWLFRTRQDLSSNDNASLATSAKRLSDAAVAVGDAESAKLAAALRENAATGLLAGKSGDSVQISIAGFAAPLEFHRVDVPDALPVYLATTDVSVGQFVGVIDAVKQWDAVTKLPWPVMPGQVDERRGPRSWEWAAGTPTRMAPPQLWLARDEDNDFAPALRVQRFNRMTLSDAAGGMPSSSHPMQQISAASALWFSTLTGCRLPTTNEWLAAYNQFEKNTPTTQLNLRDLTWELQRQYTSQARSSAGTRWPYPDVFRGNDEQMVPTPNDYRTGRTNDGALLFRPVDSAGGSVFHHLVGNVAEYTFDDVDASAMLKDNKDPSTFVNFATRNIKSFHVIGGSALSQPDVPVDQPLPVSHPDRGYSDVGLRLAITAEPKTLAQRVKWALRKQDYRWPGPSVDSNNANLQVKLER